MLVMNRNEQSLLRNEILHRDSLESSFCVRGAWCGFTKNNILTQHFKSNNFSNRSFEKTDMPELTLLPCMTAVVEIPEPLFFPTSSHADVFCEA
jgi:hypothetical protein